MGCPGNGRCDLDHIEALYEREAEERRLNALLDEARAGGSGIAIVDGAVGSGVTSLLDESARSAAHAGITVLRGRGAASLEAASLAPVLTSIGAHLDGMRAVERARLLDGLGGIAEALGGRLETSAPLAETALFESVARLARRLATEHGLLWVIDDVHLADRLTLSLLTYLAARGAPRGVVVLIGQHPSTGPALAHLRRAVRSGGGSLLELSPLSDDAAARLARRIRPDLDDEGVAVIVARSNGSPSIVWALAEADSMTPGVARLDALLERALAGADEGARTVFELIAVAGADVPHAALARLDGTPDVDRSCRQLITRGLIERTESPIGTAYRVTAPALAVAVDDALDAGRRQLAHAQLAAALEQVPGVDAEALAPHYRAAAQLLPADRTVEILVEAGTQAHERRAFQAAIPNLEAALAIGALARERVPEVLARLGGAYMLTGRPDDAVRAFRRLIGLVADDDPRAEEARFVMAVIRSDVEGGRVRVPADPGSPGRARSTAEQAVLDLFMVDRFADSDGLDVAAGRLRALDAPGATVEQRAAAALGGALASGADPVLARAHCERALALVVDGPHSVVAGALAAELARLCLALGDIDAADRAGQLAVELVHRGGPIAVEASARCLGALLPMLRGDLPEARRRAERGLALARRSATPRVMIRGLAVLALLDATQARAREAVANLGEAERTGLARFGEPRILTMVDCVHAELALLDPSRSPQLPERTLYRVDGAVQLWHPTLVGRLAIAAGRLDDADARVTTLRELGRWSSAAAALADRLEGLRRGATGATRDAADLLAGAADRLTAAGLGLPAHQARLEWAETSAPGAVERDELLELVDYFDTQALRSWGDRARQAARAHNVRVAPRRRAGDGLTRRESEVAALVAEGRSNAEIASALFLSERTVETHLAHIYQRLGLPSRPALVRYLTEREQADASRTD